MRGALVIAVKDLRQRLRDRSALVVALIAPLGLAMIVSFVFGDGFGGDFRAKFAVVDSDRSQLSRAFTDDVLGAPQLSEEIDVTEIKSESRARELISRDEISAAFLIPRGFFANVTANRRATITVLRNPDAQIGSEVADALARAYTGQINAGRLSVATAVRARGGAVDPAAIGELARAAAAERLPVQLVDGNVSVREVSGASYFGPAMAIFFLFFTTSFSARSLLAEREQGTMPRMLAAPIARFSVVAGKGLAGFAIGLTSLAVMFATFGLLLNVSWGDPLALVVLSAITVVAVMGVTAIVQVFARTQQQADALSSVVAVLLALIGGSFFPLFQMPEAVQRVSVIAPNAWALRAYSDIIYDGATLMGIGTPLLVIGAFAVVTSAIAVWRAGRIATA